MTHDEGESDRLPPLLQGLLARTSAAHLVAPAPSPREVGLLLRAAVTVPDHGELRPYRFVVVSGDGRAAFGDALAAAAAEANPELSEGHREKARLKAFAAPMQIVLVASPKAGMKIPEWEQTASAACTGYAIALAAHALGVGAIWKTAGVLDGARLRSLFALAPGERLLGWINLGRAEAIRNPASDKPRPEPAAVARVLTGDALEPFRTE